MCVSEMVVETVGGTRVWNFQWRRTLFQWEEDNASQLLASLDHVTLSNEVDRYRWSLDLEGCFSVKFAFDSISWEIVECTNLITFESKIFNNIWKSPAPSKVVMFSWQLLYDRVPTKHNLLLRGLFNNEVVLIVCGAVTRVNHLVICFSIVRWL
ncbi:hypothetical protein TSUD_237130 [Trifolium subterraneum]|uniref:Reverse transcriptase zinc-binding domain-containing protein n=1 Tax=Trifolium subterraneum TaxID=3900 RepID=A0A2Z6NHS2_TRISU|nr:hypothetical protein TSUD_237130 [Trifolium subterraneum]